MAEMILKIDNKDVKFKVTGQTPILYKSMFGLDFFNDFFKLIQVAGVMNRISADTSEKAMEDVDLDSFYRMIYCLAKKADGNIEPLGEWLDEFDSFPVFEIFGEISPLIISNMDSSNKVKANKKKAVK